MPLVTWSFISYAAGLLLGFGGVVVAGAVVGACAGLAALARRAWVHAVAALALVGGVAVGAQSRRADAACARDVRQHGRATILLRSDLAPGRAGRGIVQRDGCAVRVRVRVRRGGAAAGSAIDVDGTFAQRGDVLDVVDGNVQLLRPPGALARWRAWTASRIDRLYGRDAPLARALLLADADDLDRELRDRFAEAGIIHMLSVSGLHVGIIAAAVRTLAIAARAGSLAADLVSLGTTLAFVGFIGVPPPAVRSAAMLGLSVVARLRQRPTAPWGIWAASCAFPLLEPHVVLDLGWQLSVVGMAGLLASARAVRRATRDLRGWRRTVVASMVATTVASATTAPLVAWVFGRVSLAAVLTNVVAAPLFGVAQPLLFASLVALPLQALARPLAEAARSALWLIDLVARAGAALPWAAVRAEPDVMTACFLGVAAVAGMVALVGHWWRRPACLSLGAVALATWWPMLRPGPGRLELHMIDVGQGDALALRTPRGRWLVVDAGGGWRGGDAGATIVWPYLRRMGGDVVYLTMTHPHLDHIGGAASVLSRSGADTVWDGAYVSANPSYRDLLREARRRARAWRRVAAGDSIVFDGVVVRVLAPEAAWIATLDAARGGSSGGDPNEASVVLQVELGARRFLLTGDAEAGEEAWLLARYGEALRSDVLKVGHHGSNTSSTPAFLDAVHPRVALVSVGAGNRYGHPADHVLQSLDERGVHLLRTDDDGTIVVSTDGSDLEVRSGASRWRDASAGPPAGR
ncbi:MAG: DNA internalization-related competence protein ComEC/Rec2 [Gemmatimonadaceae bacterium]|nr:DNA internalization-related competence protein ComEC/Rec2 [Gemmatimonadaceae bacterium]